MNNNNNNFNYFTASPVQVEKNLPGTSALVAPIDVEC